MVTIDAGPPASSESPQPSALTDPIVLSPVSRVRRLEPLRSSGDWIKYLPVHLLLGYHEVLLARTNDFIGE